MVLRWLRAPSSGRGSLCTIAVFVANFCDYFLNSLCVPILPELLDRPHLSPHLIGGLFACKPAVQIVAGGFVGPMVDHVGPPAILVVGLGLLAVSAAAFAVVLLNPLVTLQAYGWMVALRCVQGVAAAMVVSAGMAWVAQVFPAADRDLAMGFVLMGNGVGAFCGAVFGGLLASALGNPMPFIIVAVVLVVDSVAVFAFPRLATATTEEQPPPGPRDPPAPRKMVDWHQVLGLLTDKHVACIVCLLFAANACLTLLQPTLPLHANHRFGYHQLGQGFVWGSIMITFTVCRPVAAALSITLTRATVLLLGVLLLCGGLALVGTAASQTGFLGDLLLIGAGVAFTTTPCMPMMANVVELRGQQNYGMAYSVADVATSLGRTLGPLVGSYLSQTLAFPAMCQCVGLANTICVLCCLPLRGLSRASPMPPKAGPSGTKLAAMDAA